MFACDLQLRHNWCKKRTTNEFTGGNRFDEVPSKARVALKYSRQPTAPAELTTALVNLNQRLWITSRNERNAGSWGRPVCTPLAIFSICFFGFKNYLPSQFIIMILLIYTYIPNSESKYSKKKVFKIQPYINM